MYLAFLSPDNNCRHSSSPILPSERLIIDSAAILTKFHENGYESAKQCYLSAGVEIEKKIFEEVGKEFKLDFKL